MAEDKSEDKSQDNSGGRSFPRRLIPPSELIAKREAQLRSGGSTSNPPNVPEKGESPSDRLPDLSEREVPQVPSASRHPETDPAKSSTLRHRSGFASANVQHSDQRVEPEQEDGTADTTEASARSGWKQQHSPAPTANQPPNVPYYSHLQPPGHLHQATMLVSSTTEPLRIILYLAILLLVIMMWLTYYVDGKVNSVKDFTADWVFKPVLGFAAATMSVLHSAPVNEHKPLPPVALIPHIQEWSETIKVGQMDVEIMFKHIYQDRDRYNLPLNAVGILVTLTGNLEREFTYSVGKARHKVARLLSDLKDSSAQLLIKAAAEAPWWKFLWLPLKARDQLLSRVSDLQISVANSIESRKLDKKNINDLAMDLKHLQARTCAISKRLSEDRRKLLSERNTVQPDAEEESTVGDNKDENERENGFEIHFIMYVSKAADITDTICQGIQLDQEELEHSIRVIEEEIQHLKQMKLMLNEESVRLKGKGWMSTEAAVQRLEGKLEHWSKDWLDITIKYYPGR